MLPRLLSVLKQFPFSPTVPALAIWASAVSPGTSPLSFSRLLTTAPLPSRVWRLPPNFFTKIMRTNWTFSGTLGPHQRRRSRRNLGLAPTDCKVHRLRHTI